MNEADTRIKSLLSISILSLLRLKKSWFLGRLRLLYFSFRLLAKSLYAQKNFEVNKKSGDQGNSTKQVGIIRVLAGYLGVFLIRKGFLGTINPEAQQLCIRTFFSKRFPPSASNKERALKFKLALWKSDKSRNQEERVRFKPAFSRIW